MAFEIHTGNMRQVTVAYSKADGSAGAVEGIPEWVLSDATMATLTVAADGLSASMKHSGASGSVTLTVNADGDLGTGVFPIVNSEEFNMLAPLGATAGLFSVGDEVPIA